MMDRRALLTTAAAAPLAGVAVAEPYDPLLGWITEWHHLSAEYEKTPDEGPETDRVWSRFKVVEDKILNTPAQTVEGFKAQMRFAFEDIAKDYCDDNLTLRAMGSLLRGVEALA